MTIKEFTEKELDDVLAFERRLRAEEPDIYGWNIDEAYIENVRKTFRDRRFDAALSLLAYADDQVVGRIDSALIFSRFDGGVHAYLDWICVLPSYRHKGIAQALMRALRAALKEKGADELVGIVAGNEEAGRFYQALEGAKISDTGIWITL